MQRDLPRSDRTRERIGTDITAVAAAKEGEREKERGRKDEKRSFFSRARSTGIVFSASFLAAESAAADREHFVPATSKIRAGTALTKRGHVARKSLSASGRIVEAR